MTDSSEAMVEFCWVWPRWMFSLTACAFNGVPSVNFKPGRSVNVTILPPGAYFHDVASPGPGFPAGSSVVIDAYTRPRTCMSQPALDVTGSHDVGSSHSQLRVPLAPLLASAADDVVGDELLQAAAVSDTARAAVSKTLLRAARERRRMGGLLSRGAHRHIVVAMCICRFRLIHIKPIGQVDFSVTIRRRREHRAAHADRAAPMPTGVLAACSRSSGTSSVPQSTTSSSGSKPRMSTVATPARR